MSNSIPIKPPPSTTLPNLPQSPPKSPTPTPSQQPSPSSQNTFCTNSQDKQHHIQKLTGKTGANKSHPHPKHTERRTQPAPTSNTTSSNTATQTAEATVCLAVKVAAEKRPFNAVAQTARVLCETRKATSEVQKAKSEPSALNKASAALHTTQAAHTTATAIADQAVKRKATRQLQQAVTTQMRNNAGLNKQPKTITKGGKQIQNPQRPRTPLAMQQEAKKAAQRAMRASSKGTAEMAKAAGVKNLQSKALETSTKTLSHGSKATRFLSRGVPLLSTATAAVDSAEYKKTLNDFVKGKASRTKLIAAYCAAAFSWIGVKVPAAGLVGGAAGIVRDAVK